MSDNLPEEVILEILCKLPVKSLIRFRSVSKSWYSLIASSHFISKHLTASQSRKYNSPTPSDQQLLLLRTCTEECTEDYSIRFDNKEFKEYKHLDFPFESCLNYYRVIGSYDGLICLADDLYVCDEEEHYGREDLGDRHSCNGSLCLSVDSYDYASSILLWNPLIKRSITLPRPTIMYKPNYLLDTLVGFGFDSVGSDYKILRIMKFYPNFNDDHLQDDEPIFEAELYSLKRESWNNITSMFPRYSFKDRDKQALARGALHWIAFPKQENHAARCLILKFHMAEETFDEIMIPECLLAVPTLHCLSVHAHGESSIAVAHENHDDPSFVCAIWVMKEYGATEPSWTKLCSIIKGEEIALMPRVLGISNSGLVWLQVHVEWISCYDLETGKIDHHSVGGEDHYNFLDSFVETLVLLGDADARIGGAIRSADAGASVASQRRESNSLSHFPSCLDFLRCLFCV